MIAGAPFTSIAGLPRGRRPIRRLLPIVMLVLSAVTASEADPFQDLNLIRPGRPPRAPDFTVPGLGSEAVTLRDFKGRAVFVNFWASWCPPCREEMPSMERLYQRYKDRGLTIVAISIDTNSAAVAPFVTTHKLTFPIGLDPSLEVANRYSVRALPSSFLIDRTGHTIAVALGPRDWDGAAAHAVIESLLK